MVSKKIIIKNPSGLHARPAAVLAKEAAKCKSEVTIIDGDKQIKAKTILNIMSAAIKKGTEIELRCEGETEHEDLDKLSSMIESGLGEQI